jgi:hypothetical protein
LPTLSPQTEVSGDRAGGKRVASNCQLYKKVADYLCDKKWALNFSMKETHFVVQYYKTFICPVHPCPRLIEFKLGIF